MKPELEEYFDNFNVMFNSEGFKQLCGDLDGRIAELDNISAIKDEADLQQKKGKREAYKYVQSLPDIMALAREQAEEEDVQDF
jgi:hypothetical protein